MRTYNANGAKFYTPDTKDEMIHLATIASTLTLVNNEKKRKPLSFINFMEMCSSAYFHVGSTSMVIENGNSEFRVNEVSE